MADELLQRLQRFREQTFPGMRTRFQDLVREGQHPTILFIGCSDSRLVPYMLTGTGPGELFIVRNVGAFVPPQDGSAGYHGTAAAIEFAVLNLNVAHIVVCGYSHCCPGRTSCSNRRSRRPIGRPTLRCGSRRPNALGPPFGRNVNRFI